MQDRSWRQRGQHLEKLLEDRRYNQRKRNMLRSSQRRIQRQGFSILQIQQGADHPVPSSLPASANSEYSEGTAVITLPARQNYVAGSYDPESFVLIGKSSIPDYLNVNPAISVIHLKVNGDASVSRIRLTGNDDAVLSGTFTTDFNRLTPLSVSNTVELISATPTALPADFYICVPPGLDERFSIEIIGADGGYMRKITKLETTTVAGTIYTLPTLTFSGTYTEGMTASLKRLTSNSAVFY